MHSLLYIAGVVAFLFTALYNVEATAQEVPLVATHERPLQEIEPPTESEESIVMMSAPMVQPLPEPPDYADTWFEEEASLAGGNYGNGDMLRSERQFLYAEAHGLPVITSRNFNQYVSSGHLVRIEGPYIRYMSSRVRPYALPATRDFIVAYSVAKYEAGCGLTTITDALRFEDAAKPPGASPFSVHTRGLAVDTRVVDLSGECLEWVRNYLLQAESQELVDATEEFIRPHMHTVIPGAPARHYLLADYGEEEYSGQSN